MPYTATLYYAVRGVAEAHVPFENLDRRFNDFRPAFRQMVPVIEEENRHRFEVEGDPPWKPYKKDKQGHDAYRRYKLRQVGHDWLLMWSGALAASLTRSGAKGAIVRIGKLELARGTGLQVGKGGEWNLGLLHHEGAPRANLPARPIMVLREQAQLRLIEIFSDFLWQEDK